MLLLKLHNKYGKRNQSIYREIDETQEFEYEYKV